MSVLGRLILAKKKEVFFGTNEIVRYIRYILRSVAKCRGSWVVGRGRGSWVWVWVNVVGKKKVFQKKI